MNFMQNNLLFINTKFNRKNTITGINNYLSVKSFDNASFL